MSMQRQAARLWTASGVNAAAAVTVPVPAGHRFVLTALTASYSATPAVPTRLTVGTLGYAVRTPLMVERRSEWTQDVTVTLPAGGAGVTGDVAVAGFYDPEIAPDYAGALVMDFLQGDFANAVRGPSGVFNPLAFSRNSVATCFGADGALRTVAAHEPRIDYDPASVRTNLILWSEAINSATWTKARGVVEANVAVAPDGTMTADRFVEDTNANSHFLNSGYIVAGALPTGSVYLKAAGRTEAWVQVIRDSGGGVSSVSNFFVDLRSGQKIAGNATCSVEPAGNGWYRCVISAGVVGGNYGLRIGASIGTTSNYQGDGVSGILVWGAQLETGPVATAYIPTTSAPRSVADICRGLLIEEQRTNSIRNNTMQGAVAGTPGTNPTGWDGLSGSANGISVNVAGVGVEDGIAYVDARFQGTSTVTGTALTASYESSANVAASNGQTWTLSTYMRLVAGSLQDVLVTHRLTNQTALALGDSAALSLSAASLAAARSAYTLTINDATTTGIAPRLRISLVNGVAYDFTLRIGMPQLELGAFATSVIPTTTAAVTRAADVCSMPVSAIPGFNAAEGTLFGEAMVGGFTPTAAASFARIARLHDSGDNSVSLAFNNTSGTPATLYPYGNVASGGVEQAGFYALNGSILVSPGAVVRQVATWALDDCAYTANGRPSQTDTSALLPAGLTTLQVGASLPATNTLNGHIRRLAYWPQRLPNNELRRLTL